MKSSQLFTKTLKDTPADEQAKNAQLLIRAGYVYKVMAGVYAYTPLGLKVLENIKQIVREEMENVGGQELIMTNLQAPEPWKKTGRWSDEVVDVWFKTKLQDDSELGLAWSHEEAIMEMMRSFVKSYKDLPIKVYQFQTKLRNELRAKSGIMRGREFLMKDMYSLHATEVDMDEFYEKVTDAYKKVYERLGLGDETFVTFASGGAFTKFSHEFQTLCDTGEDVLYVNGDKTVAVNEEVLDDAVSEMGVNRDDLTPAKSAEVGNIFKFGTEKSEQMEIYYTSEDGTKKPIYLASYGIGITRVMGVIAEKFADEKGLVWPENIAPFKTCLIQIGDVSNQAQKLYDELTNMGIKVLWDDRDERPGVKFSDAELLGIPYHVVVSHRNLQENKYELTTRSNGEKVLLTHEDLIAKLGN